MHSRTAARTASVPESAISDSARVDGLPPLPDLARWRASVPLLERMIPMNHCSHAPQTVHTRAAADAYLSSWNDYGMDWDGWMAEVERARTAFARLINAESDDVAVTTSVSAATAGLASALDFAGPRNRVVVSGAEFPTVAHVWHAHQRFGANIVKVPVRDGVIDTDAYDPALDERTLLVSACRGYYQNGFLQDIQAIAGKAHAAGALLYVDAYQSLGAERLDVKALEIDALACGNLKFLMGVPGIAFLYVRRDLAERLHPAFTGWFGRVDPYAFDPDHLDWAPGARRFDTGTPPVAAAYIARAGMELLEEAGPGVVAARTRALSARLIAGGAARGLTLHGTRDPTRKAPTTAFVVPGESHAVETALRARGILASARGPVVRMAPHFYNTAEDVDSALDALAGVLAMG